jgi:hypothetical protein
MPLCKSDFVMNQYYRKSEFSGNVWWKSSILNYRNVWNGLGDTLKSLSMTPCQLVSCEWGWLKIRILQQNVGGRHPHRISPVSVERYMECNEKFIYDEINSSSVAVSPRETRLMSHFSTALHLGKNRMGRMDEQMDTVNYILSVNKYMLQCSDGFNVIIFC